ncbi:hypothetical protein [Methylobacterium radiotolerans]|uniref:hypothetical protein n=1 Tax=Methylobacterium radiotolerans TaxID=31998 RepID=UPI0011BDC437|nr:hypothetical protein [Methylobacterium radiotolerans]
MFARGFPIIGLVDPMNKIKKAIILISAVVALFEISAQIFSVYIYIQTKNFHFDSYIIGNKYYFPGTGPKVIPVKCTKDFSDIKFDKIILSTFLSWTGLMTWRPWTIPPHFGFYSSSEKSLHYWSFKKWDFVEVNEHNVSNSNVYYESIVADGC